MVQDMKKKKGIKPALALLMSAAIAISPMAGYAGMKSAKAAGQGEFITFAANKNFSSVTSKLNFTGVPVSSVASDGSISLVKNQKTQAGAVFLKDKISESNGFSVAYEMYMGDNDGVCADGFMFVVAGNSNSIGVSGEGMGYSGIGNSIGVEYDTYNNPGESGAPHTTLNKNGSVGTGGKSLGWANGKYSLYCWVEYDAVQKKLYTAFSKTNNRNGAVKQTYDNVNVEQMVGTAYYLGFTSATGTVTQAVNLNAVYADNKYHSDGLTIGGTYQADTTAPTAPVISIEGGKFKIDGSTDTGSGVAKYQYAASANGPWTDYDSNNRPAEAVGKFYARAVDGVGNISPASMIDALDKSGPKKEVADKETAVKQALNALQNLSPADKNAWISEAGQASADAQGNIDKAATLAGITSAKNDGISALDDILKKAQAKDAEVLQSSKDQANTDVDDKADEASDDLAALKNLSDDEKSGYEQQVQDALQEAKDAINNAGKDSDIADAKKSGLDKLNEIINGAKEQDAKKLSDAKTDAKNEIDSSAQDAKTQIDNAPNLSQDEKDTAKKAIDDAAQAAKDSADGYDTVANVTDAKNTAETIIEGVLDGSLAQDLAYLQAAQNAAGTAVDQKAAEAKDAVDGLKNLSDDEKQAVKDRIDSAANTAKQEIAGKKAVTDVNDVKNQAFADINTISSEAKDTDAVNLQGAKDAANAELQQKTEEVKAGIGELTNLSDEEKAQAQKLADAILADAQDTINHFDDMKRITPKKDLAMEQLNKLLSDTQKADQEKLDNAKKDAVTELKIKALEIKEKINSMTTLTKEEKDTAKKEIEEILSAAIEEINKQDSLGQIAAVKDKAIADMSKIYDGSAKIEADNIKKSEEEAAKKPAQNQQQNGNAGGSVQTGDTEDTVLPIVLIIAALGTIGAVVLVRRRKSAR